MKYLLILFWTAAFVAVNMLAKRISEQVNLDGWSIGGVIRTLLVDYRIYVLVILYGLCAAIYMLLLRMMPLSVVGPLFCCLGIIAAAGAGVLIYKEQLTVVHSVGFLLCLAGVVCLNW